MARSAASPLLAHYIHVSVSLVLITDAGGLYINPLLVSPNVQSLFCVFDIQHQFPCLSRPAALLALAHLHCLQYLYETILVLPTELSYGACRCA